MPRYTRAWIPGGTFFFTVALLERRRTLLTDRIEALRTAFREVHQRRPFRIEAIVILPDHFHTLWTLPPDDADFSTRIRLLKASFSRTLPATERRSARRREKKERGIWQRRFWEHAIQDEDDLRRHMDYIHYNPSSMAMSRAYPTGPILRSIAMSSLVGIRQTGREASMARMILESDATGGSRPALHGLHGLDRFSENYDAIRGREQNLIDFYGGAQSVGGSAKNGINGVSDYNPNGFFYIPAAAIEFGSLPDNSPDRFRIWNW